MHEIFLIGDSIRMAYEPGVRELFADSCHVNAPNENCRFAANVLNSLCFWDVSLKKADVIHFNAGLWDVAQLYPEDGCFTPLEWYIATMEKIVRQLKKYDAKLIFATTTPCHPDKALCTGPMPPAHRNDDIMCYNEAALALMVREGIAVNDLYSVVAPHIGEYICDDLIHPTDAGKAALAQAVADKIKEALQ